MARESGVDRCCGEREVVRNEEGLGMSGWELADCIQKLKGAVEGLEQDTNMTHNQRLVPWK